MSDFDKEAEREKLREKYEEDQEKRETTEQMSELLLKGATMTNAHCGDCGDPIFRYDGQEFCPTCQKPVDRGNDQHAQGRDGEQAPDGEEATAQNGTAAPDNIEVTDPSDDASVQFGASGATTERQGAVDQARDNQQGEIGEETPTQAADETDGPQQVPSAAPSAGASQNTPRTPTSHEPSGPESMSSGPTGTAQSGTGSAAAGSVADHLETAQVVLARTVERHAKLAASADSPRETRDHLETAREAAETLDATGY